MVYIAARNRRFNDPLESNTSDWGSRMGDPMKKMLAAVAVLAALATLSACSSASAPAPAESVAAGEPVAESGPIDTPEITSVDVCAWADLALASTTPKPSVLIAEGVSDPSSHPVTPSLGVSVSQQQGETTTIECDLTYDGDRALAVKVSLSSEPGRELPDLDQATENTVRDAVTFSGLSGVVTNDTVVIELAEDTFVDISISAVHSADREANMASASRPIAEQLAAIWASNTVPLLVEEAAMQELEWAVPASICDGIDPTLIEQILGVDADVSQLSVEASSTSDSGTNGLVSDSVNCQYSAEPYQDDPAYPHRVEVKLFRYSTTAEGETSFAGYAGYGDGCPTDGTAVMYECDGGNTTTVTHSGRLMPYIQTFDGAPASVDAAALQALVLQLGAAVLDQLAQFAVDESADVSEGGDSVVCTVENYDEIKPFFNNHAEELEWREVNCPGVDIVDYYE